MIKPLPKPKTVKPIKEIEPSQFCAEISEEETIDAACLAYCETLVFKWKTFMEHDLRAHADSVCDAENRFRFRKVFRGGDKIAKSQKNH